jgi:hypothetical protein
MTNDLVPVSRGELIPVLDYAGHNRWSIEEMVFGEIGGVSEHRMSDGRVFWMIPDSEIEFESETAAEAALACRPINPPPVYAWLVYPDPPPTPRERFWEHIRYLLDWKT